jgi:hypothetical protein
MGGSLGPVHLLLLDHSAADQLVYGRLGKGGADSFAVAIPVLGSQSSLCILNAHLLFFEANEFMRTTSCGRQSALRQTPSSPVRQPHLPD